MLVFPLDRRRFEANISLPHISAEFFLAPLLLEQIELKFSWHGPTKEGNSITKIDDTFSHVSVSFPSLDDDAFERWFSFQFKFIHIEAHEPKRTKSKTRPFKKWNAHICTRGEGCGRDNSVANKTQLQITQEQGFEGWMYPAICWRRIFPFQSYHRIFTLRQTSSAREHLQCNNFHV